MIDVFLVARFEVLRAVRTWRALALVVLYGVATAGAAWLFIRMVGFMETTVAQQLGVAATETPGAMLDQLVASDTYRKLLAAMVPEHLIDFVISVPPIAMFHLWLGLLMVPFFASSSAAECISIDLRSRALRFEAQRTSRLALVVGRFAGQLVLAGVASLVATAVLWGMAVALMAGQEPVTLAGWLLWFTPRTWAFAIPFAGIGVAASQLTASPAWARGDGHRRDRRQLGDVRPGPVVGVRGSPRHPRRRGAAAAAAGVDRRAVGARAGLAGVGIGLCAARGSGGVCGLLAVHRT